MRSHLILLYIAPLLLFSSLSSKAQIISEKTRKSSLPTIKSGHFKYNNLADNGLIGRVSHIKEIFRQESGSKNGQFEEAFVIREMDFDIDGYLKNQSSCVQLPAAQGQSDGATPKNSQVFYSGCEKTKYNYDLIKKMMTETYLLKRLGKTSYEPDGKSTTTYFEDGGRKEYLRYDRNGKIIAKDTSERAQNGKTIYEFYSDDILIQRQISYMNSDGNWVSESFEGKTITKSRNENGLIKETYRDGKNIADTFERYSADGRFVVEGKCDCSWNHYRVEYKFDQNQNATKILRQRIVIKDGKTAYQPIEITTREIVYYK